MNSMSLRTALVSAWMALLSGPLSAADREVVLLDYQFSPAELRIKRGDTVTWINQEKRVSHSVFFLGSGEESERFFPGERWSRVFTLPGRYEYRCGPHPEMLGVVIVEE